VKEETGVVMAQGVASAPVLQHGHSAQGGPSNQGFQPRRQTPRHTYGAIDLGTNNCRLLIARPNEGGFTVIDAFSRIVRLGEGLTRTGELSQDAMDRAVGALSVCADKLRRRNVSLARSVATEACRRAKNGGEFAERVRNETGIVLDIIEPAEEARLAVLGCHKLLEPGDGPALIFDIGGGSTELVLVDQEEGTPRIRAWWSAPWGVVSLTESEGKEALEGEDRVKAYMSRLFEVRDDASGKPPGYPPARHKRHRDYSGERAPGAAIVRSPRSRWPARPDRGDAEDQRHDRGNGL
jgi:exopolyphosphatase/guanosine-5'-triphosphate,3'-diphosphate pyrophosphatase